MRLVYIIICVGLFACDNRSNQTMSTTSSENDKETLEKNVMRDSVYFEYYENGNKKVIASTEGGKYHGKYTALYENGNIAESGFMVNGMKSGVWKNYNEQGVLDNVKEYYNDKQMFDLDKADFSLLSRALEQEKIEINMPINWEVKGGDDPRLLLVSQKNCNESVAFCPNITFTKEKLKDEMDFNSYLQLSVDLLQKQLSYFKPVAKGEVLIDNLPAFQMTYLMQVEGIKLGGITTWINNNGVVYVVTGMAINEENSEFLKYKGLFQEVTDSFKRY